MLTKQASLFQEAGELSIGLRVAVYFFLQLSIMVLLCTLLGALGLVVI